MHGILKIDFEELLKDVLHGSQIRAVINYGLTGSMDLEAAQWYFIA